MFHRFYRGVYRGARCAKRFVTEVVELVLIFATTNVVIMGAVYYYRCQEKKKQIQLDKQIRIEEEKKELEKLLFPPWLKLQEDEKQTNKQKQ